MATGRRTTGRKTRGRLPVDTRSDEAGDDEAQRSATADVDEEGDGRPTRLDALLASIAGEGERFSVHVFRKPTAGEHAGRPVYLAPKLALSEFSLDAVRERHGGGNYEFRIMRVDDRGVSRFFRTVSQVIDGPPRAASVDVTPGGPPPGAPVAVVTSPDARIERLERLVSRLVRELRQPPAPPQPGPLDMLEKVGAIVQSFRGESADKDVMQWLNLGLKLGSKQGGGDGKESGLDKFLGELAGPFANILNGNGGPVTPAPVAMSAPSAPRMAPAHAGPEPAAAKLVPVWLQLVGPYLNVVYAWARSGDAPADRARMVLNMLPAAHVEAMALAAEADDFVASTLGTLPDAFREPGVVTWTTTFLETLRSELTEEEDTEPAGGANAQA